MKKNIIICTLYGNENFGNKLQNYALQHIIEKYDFNVKTIKADYVKNKFFRNTKNIIKYFIPRYHSSMKRYILFEKFNNNFLKYIKLKDKYNSDYFIIGSDQVWNPTIVKNYSLYLKKFPGHLIAYAPSFGVSEIPEELIPVYKNGINNFKKLSVREDAGKKILEKITNRKDIEVLIDPTMLLNDTEWKMISKKPKQYKGERYILNYFLGELSEKRRKNIEKIAKAKQCKIINILDKNDLYYNSGPSEFLWLEKNAELICTDSFHSSVFAILFNRPFVIFDREEENMNNMGSRIETLLNKFKISNRKYNGKEITKENLNHDYSNAYKILEKERKKSIEFLEDALGISK